MAQVVKASPLLTSGSPDDVIRSLRRYVAMLLGSPPWTVRVQRTRVADDQRPVAVVEEASGLVTLWSRAGTVNQGDQHKQQTFSIVCYPTVASTAASSAAQARALRDLLDAGFSRGLVTDDVPPVNIGAPWRVPIYNFAGVPIEGSARVGPDTPYGYANVDESFNLRVVQDPEDELRFTVIATARVSWWQGGRVPPRGRTVAGVQTGGWQPGAAP